VVNLILTDKSYIIVLDDESTIECDGDDIVAVTSGGGGYTKLVHDLVVGDTYIAMIGSQKEFKHENSLF
jgi:hypothetical protein